MTQEPCSQELRAPHETPCPMLSDGECSCQRLLPGSEVSGSPWAGIAGKAVRRKQKW